MILIPTLKSLTDIAPMVDAIRRTAATDAEIFASCGAGSASVNRNRCLDRIGEGIHIMLDDDMDGFWPGWDAALVEPMSRDARLVAVSARSWDCHRSVRPLAPSRPKLDGSSTETLPSRAVDGPQ